MEHTAITRTCQDHNTRAYTQRLHRLDTRASRPHNKRVSLVLQSNSKRRKIRIQFDAEGKQILLTDIEEAIREEDHAFGVLGVQLDEPTSTGADWQTVEFYNIVCVADEKAPLRVDNSVTISGGRKALCSLRNKIMELPEERMCFELDITDVYHPAPRKGSLLPWLGCTLLPGLVLAAPCYYLGASIIGIHNTLPRLLLAAIALVLAVILFSCLKKGGGRRKD